MPGIKRLRRGRGFAYVDPEGQPVMSREAIKRFRALVIPPAWTDVWICQHDDGPPQVTACAARGRKQYRYQPHVRQARDGTKFERQCDFGEVIYKIRNRVESDILLAGLAREEVVATVVWLLERTVIRVGTEELSRVNKSYGLTTLKSKHVSIAGSEMRFQFRGKSGVEHAVMVDDVRIARIVQRCQDLRGQELFQYLDDDGKRQDVEAHHGKDYLREITDAEVTAKDFRTWAGTMIAAQVLRDVGAASSQREAERNIVQAVDHTASRLGNTRTVCRKYYIHPVLIAAYLKGEVLPHSPHRRVHKPRRPGRNLPKHQADDLHILLDPIYPDRP